MNASQGLLVPAELWRICIARYLRCTDLCALMRLSRECFYFWVADASWALQRQRVCARFPDLVALFKAHETQGDTVAKSRKSNGNKRQRKTPWIMPRSGAWLVFKRYLSQCANTAQFKVACRTEELAALVACALRIHVPHEERIGKWSVVHHGNGRSNREGWWRMHTIYLWSADDKDRVMFRVLHGSDRIPCEHTQFGASGAVSGIVMDHRFISYLYVDPGPEREDEWPFEPWHHFVLERPWEPRWTPHFEERMRGK